MPASISMETLETKSTSKCPGWGVPARDHSYQQVLWRQGKERPIKTCTKNVNIDAQISGLEEELASLEIEDQLQAKQRKLASFQQSIEKKHTKLQSANQANNVQLRIESFRVIDTYLVLDTL